MISELKTGVSELYEELLQFYGDPGWWPGETDDEMIIGAMLTQNTSWRNVEVSLQKLRDAEMLNLQSISSADLQKISSLIRSSGFYNQKSDRIRNLANAIMERYNGVEAMKGRPLMELTSFLEKIKGVGQETMDCILLYALGKPVFVVDKYTIRIFERIGLAETATIESVKLLVDGSLGPDLERKRNFHGLLVKLAKDYCKSSPLCSGCPLRKKCDYFRFTDKVR